MAGTSLLIPPRLERRGTDEFVEPNVRRLVAEHLGVGFEELVAHVSLRDDLAADSLDLVEPTGEERRDGAHRPAKLYRFRSREPRIVEIF